MASRQPFTTPVQGPVLSKKFTYRQEDGWYLVERKQHCYQGTPIDGWRVWWWRFVCFVEAVGEGAKTIQF